jgi:hypothetical protein
MATSKPAAPSHEDWGNIHAKAWTDPTFRTLLETDPTAAIKQYASETGKKFDRLMWVPEKPEGVATSELSKHGSAMFPPACC